MLSLTLLLMATPAVLGKIHADDDMIIVEAKSPPLRWGAYAPKLPYDISAKDQPCLTNDGRRGRCTTVNTCYPYFRLAHFKATEQWVMGTINTCKAQRSNRNYIYGVCCPFDQPETRSIDKKPVPDVNFDLDNKPVYDINYNFSLHPLSEEDKYFPFENYDYENFTYEDYYLHDDETPLDYPDPLGGTDRLSSGSDLMTKILNGRVARKNKYPFMAALMNRGQFFCGGSLITNRHVLTAAHCVAFLSAFDIDNITIRLGDHNLKRSQETRHAVRRVRRIVRNKTFNTSTLYGDIAIIQLKSRVRLTPNKIETICLEQVADQDNVGSEAKVAGWGSAVLKGPKGGVLRVVDVRLWNNTECAASYLRKGPPKCVQCRHIQDTQLCASKPEEGKDSCHMRSRVRLRRNRVETICLEPAENKNHVGKEATVAGWGALKYDYHKSAVLREVDVRVWNNTECDNSYGSKAPGGIIDTMMCASKPEEGKDSCLGDSGGPLFNCDSKNSNCRQIGIVSWGVKCGVKEYPGVYTNVAKYKDWINGYMKQYATGHEKVFCTNKKKKPERLSVPKTTTTTTTTIIPKIRPSSFG